MIKLVTNPVKESEPMTMLPLNEVYFDDQRCAKIPDQVQTGIITFGNIN